MTMIGELPEPSQPSSRPWTVRFGEDGTEGMPEGFRSLEFLGGPAVTVPVDTCRGCLMVEREAELPHLLAPVFDNGCITVRQDAEWAVPGFMVIGLRPHIGAIDEMDLQLVEDLARVMYTVRKGMREALGIRAVQMYQEEKLDRPHFHVWMLPLWPDVMAKHQINPRIYESNIAAYLELFSMDTHGADVVRCVERLRDYMTTVSCRSDG